MTYELTNFLLQYVLNSNPGLDERNITKAIALNDYDLLIEFIDGTQVIFDTYSNTSRRVSSTNDTPTDEDLRNEFKERLYKIMLRKGIDEKELAKRVGTTQPMISRYITGRSIPNAITLKRIANALGCSVDDFYYRKF